MISRFALLASLLPLSALAQLQVFQFDGTNDTSVGAVVNVGSATPGDTIIVRFHVRNIGSGPEVLSTLSLAGSGFSITSAPSLPYTIAPYTGSPISEAEFKVAFSPTDVLSYDAFLTVNTINIIVEGAGVPSAVLTLAGSNVPLNAGAIIDFGPVQAGVTKSLSFNLSNPGSASITIPTLTVTGGAFTGPIGAKAPITLAAGHTASFQVNFKPTSGEAFQGTLSVGDRSFTLTGQGLNPPLPTASIVFSSSTGHSAQQNSVTIPLASASKVDGTGTLTMTFQSSVDGVKDDAAIQFLSGPLRRATVTISSGDKAGHFDGGQPDLTFQTGTTAGVITFTLTLNGASTPAAQASLTIAPAAVNVETATSVRRLGALDVSITAFDNTYSASELAFTFYDTQGTAIQPGLIHVDSTAAFRSYFATTQTGGSFALLATFPVTGDTSQIASVDVQLTNTAGTTTASRITIGN